MGKTISKESGPDIQKESDALKRKIADTLVHMDSRTYTRFKLLNKADEEYQRWFDEGGADPVEDVDIQVFGNDDLLMKELIVQTRKILSTEQSKRRIQGLYRRS